MQSMFISDLVGEDYKKWRNKKIFLSAPTGMGKTTFILDELLPYFQVRGKKMLILCNRKMLRKQYWYALVRRFDRYTIMQNSVEIKTYQQLAEQLRQGIGLEELRTNYDVICCDEAHYFYADSDFNGYGTYVLLQAIIYMGFAKQMIFMSATMEEVEPLLEQTIKRAAKLLKQKNPDFSYEEYSEIMRYKYAHLANYSRFECYCSPDIDTLCEAISREKRKSIVFIDDKSMAKEMAEKIERVGKIRASHIKLINAQNLDDEENNYTISQMVMCHRLIPQVLITTSVLDNGVSIQDPDVGNVVIITESPVSFLQMIGRVRAGYCEKLKLHFLQRDGKIFQRREQQYKRMIDVINDVMDKKPDINRYQFLSIVWEDSDIELASIYKKIFVCTHRNFDFYVENTEGISISYGDTKFSLNQFGIEKIGNQYLLEGFFHTLAMDNPLNVIYEQMALINKNPNELVILNSTYLESKKEQFISELLKIKNYSLAQLREKKNMLTVEYRKDFFADVVSKNGSFATEKLKQILAEYNLDLLVKNSDEGNRYSVVEMMKRGGSGNANG